MYWFFTGMESWSISVLIFHWHRILKCIDKVAIITSSFRKNSSLLRVIVEWRIFAYRIMISHCRIKDIRATNCCDIKNIRISFHYEIKRAFDGGGRGRYSVICNYFQLLLVIVELFLIIFGYFWIVFDYFWVLSICF